MQELSAEKSKVASVETRLSSQLSKREQEMIALQARMQASYQDHVAQTQTLNAKVSSHILQLKSSFYFLLIFLLDTVAIVNSSLKKSSCVETDAKQLYVF